MSRFAEPENITFLEGICARYLSDTLDIKLPREQLANAIFELVSTVQQMPDQAQCDLSELNKRVMGLLKRKIAMPPPQQSQLPQLQQLQQPQQMQMPPALPQPLERPSDTQPDRDTEGSFMAKLDFLEKQRSVTATQLPPGPPMPYIQATQAAQAPPVAQLPTVTQVPPPVAPPRVILPSKAIVVHGYERDYKYHANRATFLWPGHSVGPSSLDSSMISLVAAMLPPCRMKLAPFVKLGIEGAGGQKVEFLLNLAGQAQALRPFSKGLALMRMMACPWTISLKTADGHELPLGSDTYIVKSVEVIGPAIYSIYIDHESDFADVGDRMCFTGATTSMYGHVHGISPGRLIVISDATDGAAGDLRKIVGWIVLNMTRQVTLIFEASPKN